MAEYKDFITETGYEHEDGRGLCGFNCRHSFAPFYPGISHRNWNDDKLDEYAGREMTYTDWQTGEKNTVSQYEATQEQRHIERQIREWSKRSAIKDAAGIDNDAEKLKLREWRGRLKSFTQETGLRRQPAREQITKLN